MSSTPRTEPVANNGWISEALIKQSLEFVLLDADNRICLDAILKAPSMFKKAARMYSLLLMLSSTIELATLFPSI